VEVKDLKHRVKDMVRADGWANILTGLGMKSKDKRMSADIKYEILSEGDAEQMYAADEMAAKIVDMLPMDMLREGFRVASPDLDEDVLEQAMDYFEKLTLTEDGSKLGEAMIWGRMYGGAALVIGALDSQEPEEPLDENRLQSLEHLTLLNRYELIPQDINGNPASANFGMPENYIIQPRVTGTVSGDQEANNFANGSVKIHHSRIVRFDGKRLARHMLITNNYWHDSILNPIKDDIRDYQNAYASASALILDFAQAVYKVKNLADIVSAPDGMKIIQDRIAIIDMARSVLRASIVDADGEDFERKTTSLAGLDKTLEMLSKKFTSSTEYPHTVLLGEGAGNSKGGGLGNSGQSEKEDYFETVRSRQMQILKPRLLKIFRLIFAASDGPTGGAVPEKFDIEFEPLKHLSQLEMIEARKKQAESDKIYAEIGAVDPSEIALSRFGSGEYSFETEIDVVEREKLSPDFESKTFGNEPEPPTPGQVPPQENRGDSAGGRKKAKRSRRFNGKRYSK